MNKFKPGSVVKIHSSGGSLKLRENIGLFQTTARAYGVTESEVFQAVDIFDKQNLETRYSKIFFLMKENIYSILLFFVMRVWSKSSCSKTKSQRI